ncbi:MAG: DUF4178 domain-containing protein [Proteobacteria bacterium]|nr:DUF4178 domain-containing protein [Pseudomonadota bacterium]
MSIAAQCPNCGAPIEFHVASSVVSVCDSCNTVIARTDRAVEDLGKTSDLVQTRSPLSLWLSGQYQGVGFQLTGRAQIRHGAGGVWDEWYMAFDNGAWGWLAEAQGAFYLTFRQPEAGPIDPQSLHAGHPIQVGIPPRSMVVAETSEAEILAGRGEIPYRLEVGRRYWYVDLSGPGGAFGTLDFGEQPPGFFLGAQVTLDQLGIGVSPSGQQYGHGDHGGAAGPDYHYDDYGAVPAQQVSVEGVTCQHCGGALELHAPDRAERVACPYCGALHDCDHGVLALLKAAEKSPVTPAIPLGSMGTFEDQDFTVIGFMTRTASSSWEIFEWDEYLLYNPQAGFRWLTYSDLHWTYLAPVSPGDVVVDQPPRGYHHASETAQYLSSFYKVFQAGSAQVKHVAGEFYWKVEVGQTTHTVDYIDPPEILSGDDNGTEVHWSFGHYMTRSEIADRFPNVDVPRLKPQVVAPHQPFGHKGVYVAWGALVALSVVALFWASASQGQKTMLAKGFQLPAQQRASAESSVFFTEPFELKGGQNIEVKAYGTAVDNSWMFVQGDLYSEKTGLVVPFDLSIEYYRGPDWSEGGRSASKYLSAVPAGTYSLRVAVERSDWRRANALQITIKQGMVRFLYWLLALLLLSIIPIGVMIHHVKFEKRRWSQSDFRSYDL